MVEGNMEIPLTAHRELKTLHQNIASVSTHKISYFLGGVDIRTPEVKIKYNNGQQVASIENQKVALRPFIRLERRGTFIIPARFTIHEIAHIVGDKFLEVAKDDETCTAIYLSEGLAEYLSIDDPANIYDDKIIVRDSDEPNDTYKRLRDEINEGGMRGETIKSYFSLNRLFVTHQPDLSKEFTKLTEAEEAKAMTPYIIGGTLVRFILEKGGVESLKRIMQKVQVKKVYAFGWNVSKDQSFDYTGMNILEEDRVNALLKEAILKEFGNVNDFEQEWKEKVLGKQAVR